MTLTLTIPLPAAVGFSPDVLGTSVPVRIGGTKMTLHAPVLRDDDEHVLYQPHVLDHLVVEEEYSDGHDPDTDDRPDSPWGFASAAGDGWTISTYEVTRLVAVAAGVAANSATDTIAVITRDFAAWFDVVKDWCEVVARQDLDYVAPRRRFLVDGQGWDTWVGSEAHGVPRRLNFDPDYGDPVEPGRWERIATMATIGMRPTVEHLLLRDARAAHARGQYRRAVIDASTATEVALHQMLVATHTADPSVLGAELMRMAEKWAFERLRTVAARVATVPPTLTKAHVDLRNAVVHKSAKEPTKTESEAMLIAATDTVQIASPLDPTL